jgi:hypothetical protein
MYMDMRDRPLRAPWSELDFVLGVPDSRHTSYQLNT